MPAAQEICDRGHGDTNQTCKYVPWAFTHPRIPDQNMHHTDPNAKTDYTYEYINDICIRYLFTRGTTECPYTIKNIVPADRRDKCKNCCKTGIKRDEFHKADQSSSIYKNTGESHKTKFYKLNGLGISKGIKSP